MAGASRSELPGTSGQETQAAQETQETQAVKETEPPGAGAIAVGADLPDENDLEDIVPAPVGRPGSAGILAGNVSAAAATGGRGWPAPLPEMPRAGWPRRYAVSMHAPFTLIGPAGGAGRGIARIPACSAACGTPHEYTGRGRVFFAGREPAALGLTAGS